MSNLKKPSQQAMPFCMAQCGLVLGLLVLLFCGIMTLQSSLMLIKSAKSKNKKTYEYLAQACFGSTGKFAIEFAQIGLMLGTCIGKEDFNTDLVSLENNSF